MSYLPVADGISCGTTSPPTLSAGWSAATCSSIFGSDWVAAAGVDGGGASSTLLTVSFKGHNIISMHFFNMRTKIYYALEEESISRRKFKRFHTLKNFNS